MDGHVGIEPTIPAWKAGAYLPTPVPEEMEVTFELDARAFLTKSSGSKELWELVEDLKRTLLAEEVLENASPQITQTQSATFTNDPAS